jgi:hypothetical protein
LCRLGPEGVRFLLVSGQPIKEPVAWHGPIVMNTREELMQAIQDLQTGNFIICEAAVHFQRFTCHFGCPFAHWAIWA